MRRIKVICMLALIGWTLFNLLFPSWEGRSYKEDALRRGVFVETGSFGLQESTISIQRHAIWSPPSAASVGIRASVRWPWQPAHQNNHVEPSLVYLIENIAFGIIVIGVVLLTGHWMVGGSKTDLVISITRAVTLSLILAALVIMCLIYFTFGYGATHGVIISILLAFMLFGVIYGFVSYRLMLVNPEAGNGQPNAMGLFWFTAGGILAGVAAIVAAGIAMQFRGVVLGTTELGTPRYSNEQAMVNLVTGCTLVVIGGLLGLIMKRFKWHGGFIVGWIAGMIVLGVTFACWK